MALFFGQASATSSTHQRALVERLINVRDELVINLQANEKNTPSNAYSSRFQGVVFSLSLSL